MKITKKIPTPTCRRSRILDADTDFIEHSRQSRNKIGIGTTLEKILEKKGAAKILMKNGVPCLSCPMASFEIDKLKIGEICKMYGLNLVKILKELNSPN